MRNTVMENLSAEAKKALEDWVREHTPLWEAEGADVSEVREDVEAHMASEFSEKEGEIELKDVQEVLSRMGLPPLQGVTPSPVLRGFSQVEAGSGKEKKKESRVRRFFKCVTTNWFWVVVWPVGVVLFEMLSNFCGNAAFTPIPSWWHAVLVLAACGGAGYHYWCIRRTEEANTEASVFHSIIRGAVMVVAGYWSLLLLPVVIMGTVGYGFGVIFSIGIMLLAFPIFVLCVLAAGSPMLLGAGLLRRKGLVFSKAMSWVGVVIGLALLLMVEGPSYMTRYGVAKDSPSLIRSLGSKKILLQMCYEGRGGRSSQLDTSGFLLSVPIWDWGGGNSSNTDKARKLYYQVTGRAFNAVAAPKGFLGMRREGREFEFDEDLGGDGVFARLKDLDLTASRLDGHVDHASRLGYWEWTAEFSNESLNAKEARMQLLLPPGGVVSRLTLWVNGEPREAAFSSVAKVTEAYKSVAVVQRRDPVLVRWVAPDRVLVQCFPVPANGKMKIRVGVTAPLKASGKLFLPRIIEQNFGFAKNLKTNFWVQGDVEMEMEGIKAKGVSGRWRETHGDLSVQALVGKHAHVVCHGSQAPSRVWTVDPFAEEAERVVLRETVENVDKQTNPEPLVVVIDASSGLADWREAIADSLEVLKEAGHSLHVVLAAEDKVLTGEKARQVRNVEFVGGQNNVAALEKAFDLAAEHQVGRLLWIHGTQPVEFGSTEALLQRLERGFHQAKIATLDLSGGANRVLESLSKAFRIDGQGRPTTPDDLQPSLNDVLNDSSSETKWATYPQGTVPANAVKVWDQLARWLVWKEVKEAERSPSVVKRAALYQLVTPVSGAVVLETKAQFDAFGLKPIDPNAAPSIPSIPEPSSSLLTLIGLTILLCRRRRKA